MPEVPEQPVAPAVAPVEPDAEQQVRDRFGYAATEKRTERERSDAAARMLKRDPEEYWLARHRPRTPLPESAPLVPDTERLIPPGQSVPVPRPEFMLSEEQYVRSELSITKALLLGGRIRDHDGKTLQRSEAYLRWRYNAFLAGEVAGL